MGINEMPKRRRVIGTLLAGPGLVSPAGRLAIAVEGAMTMHNGLENVTFERSGGSFPLTLGGSVILSGLTPGVRSEAVDGIRPLTARETAMFERLDPANLRAAPSPITPPLPDTYQWDVALHFAGAAPVALRWYSPGPPSANFNSIAPGLFDLADWVRKEIDRVWARRTGKTP
jgi:hypothetical protein